jgi:hypothetical protein
VRQVKNKVKSMLIIFFDIKRTDCSAILTHLGDAGRITGGAQRPHKHDFQDAFKKWQKQWERCICENGFTSRLILAKRPKVSFLTSPGNY